MKKQYFLLFLISLTLFGCVVDASTNVVGDVTESEKTEDNDSNQDNTKKTITKLTNNSSFIVDCYSDVERATKIGTISKGASLDVEDKPSVAGTVYYLTYHVDIGVDLPWYDGESYVVSAPEENQTKTVIIGDPLKMGTFDAYIILENNTTNELIFKQGSSELLPENLTSTVLNPGDSGIYILPSRYFGNFSSFKITVNNNVIDFPSGLLSFEEGNIYTISVNYLEKNNLISASLKAVTPFNIDTQKKIWSVDEKYFSSKYPICMRPSYDGKKTWVMGTATTEVQKVGFISIDEYGNYLFDADYFLAFSNSKDLVNTTVVDFLEEKDGSIVMLCRQEFRDYETFVLTNYNCSTKTLKWSKVFGNMSYGNNTFATLNFRNDSKNKLLKLGENKYAFVGIYDFYQIDNDNYLISDEYKYLIAYIDASDKNSVKIVENISADSTDLLNGIERALTSAYFDGTDLYVCGYDNWSPSDYSTTHVGKIWKASLAELEAGTFDFNSNVIYSKDNCLFFSIDGTNGNTKNSFVACGEYTDTGKILKGFYVTSSMIKNNASATPVLYTVSGKSYCWFNQLCQYENKIVLCGKAANSFDGTNAPLPFVVAYDYNGNKLWENLSFVKYSDAMNILSNTIGTYMLQLGNSENKIHYVNADLLGKEVIVK